MRFVIILLALILGAILFGPWLLAIIVGLGSVFYFVLIGIILICVPLVFLERHNANKLLIEEQRKQIEEKKLQTELEEKRVEEANASFKKAMSKSKIFSRD